jgi:hypothetical protein
VRQKEKCGKLKGNNNFWREYMGEKKLPPLMDYFAGIKDPRRETKNKKYPLI